MAAERLSMRKIKEVLRLDAAGQSHRAIARSVMVARSTVKEYLQRAATAGLSWPVPNDLSDTALEALLFSSGSCAGGRQALAGLASHLRRDEDEGPDRRHASAALAGIQGG